MNRRTFLKASISATAVAIAGVGTGKLAEGKISEFRGFKFILDEPLEPLELPKAVPDFNWLHREWAVLCGIPSSLM